MVLLKLGLNLKKVLILFILIHVDGWNDKCMVGCFTLDITKQAGAEVGKAQPKLGLGKIKINLALVKSRKVVWD